MFVAKVSDTFNYSYLLRNILNKLRESSRRMFHKTSVPKDLGYSCEDEVLFSPLILEVLWDIFPMF